MQGWLSIYSGDVTAQLLSSPPATTAPSAQVTLRRLSEALRSTDLEELAQSSQMDLGLGLGALDGSSAETISASLEVRRAVVASIRPILLTLLELHHHFWGQSTWN